jgi:hypothetical protein
VKFEPFKLVLFVECELSNFADIDYHENGTFSSLGNMFMVA